MIQGKNLTKVFLKSISNRHTAVVGMTRSGKTFLCNLILTQLQSMGIHTIFFDPKHDRDYASLGTICTTPMQFYAQILLKNPSIVYRPPGGKQERQEHLTEIIDIVFRAARNKKLRRIKRVIAIDEIQLVVKKGGHDGVEKLWTVGAGLGIVGFAISQRIQNLNETVWSQSENKILFRVEDRNEYLRSRNLNHFADLRNFFLDPAKRYWYYYTLGNGEWKKHPPAGERKKYTGPLRLKR